MRSSWTPTTRVVIVAVLLILIGLLVNAIRPLISPMIIAALGAYTLYPLAARLENHPRITYKWAVALVYFPFTGLLIAAPSAFAPMLIRQIRTLTGEALLVFNLLEARLEQPVTILGRTVSQEQLAEFLRSVSESFTPAAEDAIHALEVTSTSLLWFIVILVTIYFMLLDWQGLRDWFIAIFPKSEQADLTRLLRQINATWRGYMRGTLALMFIMGVFFIIVGLAIGLPGAVALGLLTGFLSIIPELGPTIAGILSVLVAFFEGSNFLPLSNFWFAILVGGIYIVVMQVKSLWLRPLVMGRFMHMNTGLVFIAIIGAALIWGVLAALVILPVLASAGQIGRYIRAKLLDEDPWQENSINVT